MQIGEALDALIAKRDELRRWIEQSAPVGEAGDLDDALADLRDRLRLAAGRERKNRSAARSATRRDWNARVLPRCLSRR